MRKVCVVFGTAADAIEEAYTSIKNGYCLYESIAYDIHKDMAFLGSRYDVENLAKDYMSLDYFFSILPISVHEVDFIKVYIDIEEFYISEIPF